MTHLFVLLPSLLPPLSLSHPFFSPFPSSGSLAAKSPTYSVLPQHFLFNFCQLLSHLDICQYTSVIAENNMLVLYYDVKYRGCWAE